MRLLYTRLTPTGNDPNIYTFEKPMTLLSENCQEILEFATREDAIFALRVELLHQGEDDLERVEGTAYNLLDAPIDGTIFRTRLPFSEETRRYLVEFKERPIVKILEAAIES